MYRLGNIKVTKSGLGLSWCLDGLVIWCCSDITLHFPDNYDSLLPDSGGIGDVKDAGNRQAGGAAPPRTK